MPKWEIGRHNYAEWLEKARACRDIVFQGLDLREDDWRLAELAQADRPDEGCVFIACKLGPKMREAAALHFATIFPEFSWRPYHVYRDALYTPEELYRGFDPAAPESYRTCPDWRIYASYIECDSAHKPFKPTRYVPASADELVMRRLHDHFIGISMHAFLAGGQSGRGVVAFMGGHDERRSSPSYAQVAAMSRTLSRAGFLMTTGGGPGLMEAANLGAFLAPAPDHALTAALAWLAQPGGDRYDDPLWLTRAWQLRERHPERGVSLGVPTWFYGHEPPNVFASHIAKYFENSNREEGLLAIATHGIVFAPGNAGTVQEIFQDGCQNYYDTYGHKSPMILFGEEFWNPTPDEHGNYAGKAKPAWPLLRKLAQEKGFEDLVCVTSDASEVVRRIVEFRLV